MEPTKFKEGGIVYHKATGQRCVIIAVGQDKKVTVRTYEDKEREYFPQELETEEENEQKNRNLLGTEERGW